MRRGIRVKGLHHRFQKFWKIGMDYERFLRERGSAKFDSLDEKKLADFADEESHELHHGLPMF